MWSDYFYVDSSPSEQLYVGFWSTTDNSLPLIEKGQENYYFNLLKYYQLARPEFFRENLCEGRPIMEILYNLGHFNSD